MVNLKKYGLGLIFALGCQLLSAQPEIDGIDTKPKFKSGSIQHVDGILAVVGNKVISFSDFENEKVQMARGKSLSDSSKSYCQLLEDNLVRTLMLCQAEVDSLPVEDERVEAEIENRLRYFQRQAGGVADLERYLGKSISEFKEEIRPKIKENLLAQSMRQKITTGIRISPKEVKQYYSKLNQDSLPVIPTEVEVAQLVLEVPVSDFSKEFTKNMLEEIRTRILKGESFERMARTYSVDPGSKNNNGILPEFGHGEMVDQFERMAFKLKPDSISPVFQTRFGYHIMKVYKRKGERVTVGHILLRPEHTSDDLTKAQNLADSLHTLLTSGKLDWCKAVKSHASEQLGNKGYCGFITDEATGLQKTQFDGLSTDLKVIVEKMNPGQFSKPQFIQTPDGTSVFRMVYLKSFIAPHEMNLVQDYSRVQMEAEENKRQMIIDKWVDKYKKKTYIHINQQYSTCENLKKWQNE